LSLFARGSLGKVDLAGRRTFLGTANGETVSKQVDGEWSGTLMSFSGGVSYEMRSGSAFLRPSVTLDYVTLDEDGYSETGGGDALDLTVDGRKSDELGGNAGVAVGLDFLGRGGPGSWLRGGPANRWFRVEAEGGWREVVGGSIGATTARFDGGTPFTLEADQADSGWFARLRAVGGGSIFELGGEVGAEQRNGNTGLSMRGTVRIGF
jgi:outer membrane autotransporter protein